jgi:hypothetical protein
VWLFGLLKFLTVRAPKIKCIEVVIDRYCQIDIEIKHCIIGLLRFRKMENHGILMAYGKRRERFLLPVRQVNRGFVVLGITANDPNNAVENTLFEDYPLIAAHAPKRYEFISVNSAQFAASVAAGWQVFPRFRAQRYNVVLNAKLRLLERIGVRGWRYARGLG